MNSKQNILKTLGANETKIKSFGVRSLSLFGSSARGQDSPASDLDFIGEAAKMVPESVRANYPSVEWKKIAGLRDILAHQYFEVDLNIWDILTNKLPELERQINAF